MRIFWGVGGGGFIGSHVIGSDGLILTVSDIAPWAWGEVFAARDVLMRVQLRFDGMVEGLVSGYFGLVSGYYGYGAGI